MELSIQNRLGYEIRGWYKLAIFFLKQSIIRRKSAWKWPTD